MRLPVIQTCGECGFSRYGDGQYGGSWARACQHPKSGGVDVSRGPPPHSCPLRTGPDAERISRSLT